MANNVLIKSPIFIVNFTFLFNFFVNNYLVPNLRISFSSEHKLFTNRVVDSRKD